ncbi:tRNA pseudouridine synthase D [Kushneria pakistanensis]|uniref:tRNA pseudouridine synthase D n=1 Tax=Kushneria pakistanensis TaxID=1508770 RepID=A0ABQ3FLX2_9GAMM|nr:tRNA pseudouridine(13) synthase TruD [Kushneria pakistanensis]GHC29748.1 tRNA pseudouridine synthase D [Kushneria pakistanensis]
MTEETSEAQGSPLPDWARSLGVPPHSGRFREFPEAFRVEEQMAFTPEGEGEHLWLHCEKRNLSTAQLIRHLAHTLEVAPRDIGVSGLKDHTALTRQWVSVALTGRATPAALPDLVEMEGLRLLSFGRHPRKLRRGVHRANRFALYVTGEAVTQGSLETRWHELVANGVPNYFGPQRFGHQGSNITRARAMMARGWKKRHDRDGILLSSARSWLFNQVLSTRIEQGNWASGLDGDVFNLDGSASQFAGQTLDDALRTRLAALDIHPTGPLWGRGKSEVSGEALALERGVVENEPTLAEGIERAGAAPMRRALRLRLQAPAIEHEGEGLWLHFTLARGGFATAVLRELFQHPAL